MDPIRLQKIQQICHLAKFSEMMVNSLDFSKDLKFQFEWPHCKKIIYLYGIFHILKQNLSVWQNFPNFPVGQICWILQNSLNLTNLTLFLRRFGKLCQIWHVWSHFIDNSEDFDKFF